MSRWLSLDERIQLRILEIRGKSSVTSQIKSDSPYLENPHETEDFLEIEELKRLLNKIGFGFVKKN